MARLIALAWCLVCGLTIAAASIGLLLPAGSLRVSSETAAAIVVVFVVFALAAGRGRIRRTAKEQG